MTHPLDRVESALIDAVNAMDDALDSPDSSDGYSATVYHLERIWAELTAVLRVVQEIRERDLDALERS